MKDNGILPNCVDYAREMRKVEKKWEEKMDNNDFLTAIEKGKERLTDANRSKEDYWFSGSMVMLEACLEEVWNTAKKDTIPIEWLKKKYEEADDMGMGIEDWSEKDCFGHVIKEWEKENGSRKE